MQSHDNESGFLRRRKQQPFRLGPQISRDVGNNKIFDRLRTANGQYTDVPASFNNTLSSNISPEITSEIFPNSAIMFLRNRDQRNISTAGVMPPQSFNF